MGESQVSFVPRCNQLFTTPPPPPSRAPPHPDLCVGRGSGGSAHLKCTRPAPTRFRAPLQYSFSLTTFSPSGKLVQIEYALNAVNAGATSLGIKATNGVVIATERKLPSILVDETTVGHVPLSVSYACTSCYATAPIDASPVVSPLGIDPRRCRRRRC